MKRTIKSHVFELLQMDRVLTFRCILTVVQLRYCTTYVLCIGPSIHILMLSFHVNYRCFIPELQMHYDVELQVLR